MYIYIHTKHACKVAVVEIYMFLERGGVFRDSYVPEKCEKAQFKNLNTYRFMYNIITDFTAVK